MTTADRIKRRIAQIEQRTPTVIRREEVIRLHEVEHLPFRVIGGRLGVCADRAREVYREGVADRRLLQSICPTCHGAGVVNA